MKYVVWFLRSRYVLLLVSGLILVIILACGSGGGSDNAAPSAVAPTTTGITNPEGDALITSFQTALQEQNTTSMEALFSVVAWTETYKTQLTSVNTDLQALSDNLDNAVLVLEETNFLLYRIQVQEDENTSSYYIQMIKENGSWKIVSM